MEQFVSAFTCMWFIFTLRAQIGLGIHLKFKCVTAFSTAHDNDVVQGALDELQHEMLDDDDGSSQPSIKLSFGTYENKLTLIAPQFMY